MGRPRNVALAFLVGLPHLQPLVSGITEYARQHGHWTLTTALEGTLPALKQLRGWPGDGVIATVQTAAERREAAALSLPIVSFAGALPDPGVPRVTNDNLRIGKLVAQHLLERGFVRFGYYGLRGVHYADLRERSFIAELMRRGHSVATHRARNTLGARRLWPHESRDLEAWLASLQTPVGVFTANDLRARMVIDACARLGLNVPHDVGVIGCDDDRVTCEFGQPTLSSVRCDWFRIGHQTAALLDRLMNGGRAGEREKHIAPLGVVARASTDTFAVNADEPSVAAAVRMARAARTHQLRVPDLLRAASVSRRTLELAFRRALNCTPREFLVRERLRRAKVMLANSSHHTLDQVARACGFTEARRLRAAFVKFEGVRPMQFAKSSKHLEK